MKSQIDRLAQEGAECTCENTLEHRALLHRMDVSYKKDDERAKLRQQRSTQFLRSEVVRHQNGG